MNPAALHWLKSLSYGQFVGCWVLFDLATDSLLLPAAKALRRAWRRYRHACALRAVRPGTRVRYTSRVQGLPPLPGVVHALHPGHLAELVLAPQPGAPVEIHLPLHTLVPYDATGARGTWCFLREGP